MKKILLITLLLSFFTVSFSQKVKFKKETIFVDGMEWGQYEQILWGKKYSYKTLSGEEYAVVTFESIATGKYNNQGKEITENYMTVNFLNTDLGTFEIAANSRKQIVKWLVNTTVILEDKFVAENAEKFKNKYQESISDKYKKGTTIIINN